MSTPKKRLWDALDAAAREGVPTVTVDARDLRDALHEDNRAFSALTTIRAAVHSFDRGQEKKT